MENTEIELRPEIDLTEVERAIDTALAAAGLAIVLRGSLQKFPGCIHWHARQPGESGTLEITLWPQAHRAWFTVQSGRRADWIDGKQAEMRRRLRPALAGPAAKRARDKD